MDRNEQLEAFLEFVRTLRLGEIPRIVKALPWSVASTLAAVLIGVFGAGYGAYPFYQQVWHQPKAQAAGERRKPENVNIETFEFGSGSQSPWEVPVFSFLENEAESETESGRIQDYVTLRVETSPFEWPTYEFRLKILALADYSLSAYAYRIHRRPEGTHNRDLDPLFQPFVVFREKGKLLAEVPRCEKGDSLLLLVRLSSNSDLPTDPSVLRDRMKLEVQR